jgi:Zn-dependent peptidase ImmA (M78 family)
LQPFFCYEPANVAGIDANRGAKRAREARAALGLHPVEPLSCVLTTAEDAARLPVVVRPWSEDIAGACVRGESGVVLWLNGEQPVVRQRFTLAHELGHAWCGHDGATSVDTIATLSGRTTDAREIQANSFAAEFLVPRAAIEQLIEGDPTLEHLVLVGAAYGVSAWVVLFRCQTAGVVGEARAERLRTEIDERLHLRLRDQLDPPALRDRLSRIDALPYLSPALRGSALAARLAGQASADAVASATGSDPDELDAAVDGLAR